MTSVVMEQMLIQVGLLESLWFQDFWSVLALGLVLMGNGIYVLRQRRWLHFCSTGKGNGRVKAGYQEKGRGLKPGRFGSRPAGPLNASVTLGCRSLHSILQRASELDPVVRKGRTKSATAFRKWSSLCSGTGSNFKAPELPCDTWRCLLSEHVQEMGFQLSPGNLEITANS